MAKMRAMQVGEAGGAFELVERDVPRPGRGEALVRVHACGICHSDAMAKEGSFPIAGHASGSSRDSEDTLSFSVLCDVRPMIETLPLERAQAAFDKMISGEARFRMVLTTGA